MITSKSWDWEKENSPIWLRPSEESYYLADRWKAAGFTDILDFGCGLGRHSIFFAKNGFKVSSFDLSAEGVGHLQKWAERENLDIDAKVADMLDLPYATDSFDCIFAYHVISHTDTKGIKKIIDEIKRVLREGGEIYLTLCSKDSRSFKDAGYPRLDENTIVKTDEGPEKGVPHFYTTLDDILLLFKDFEIIHIRHVDDCFFDGKKQNSKHYFVLGKLSKNVVQSRGLDIPAAERI
ncbi:MAG: class I SAM-dependent methyltransferase [Bacillota bacterium]